MLNFSGSLRALLWKDTRVNRLPLLMCAALLVVPYLIVATAVMQMPLWTEASASSAWAVLLATGCYFSVMCSQAGLAMLSGHLIAVERADRSIEFMAYLPPSRGQLLLSKALVLAGTAAIVWLLNLAVQQLANWLAEDAAGAQALTPDLVSFPFLAAVGALAMGTGWCASCMLEGTGAAVGLAIFSPIVLVGLLQSVSYFIGWPNENSFGEVYRGACWLFAFLFLILGSLYFLQRVEP
jgi:hypothetical protein